MDIIYRPELESPPMAKECIVTFTTLTGTGESDAISFKAGLNKGIPADRWDQIKEIKYAQNLLSTGALRVLTKEEAREVLDKDEIKDSGDVSISSLKPTDAIEIIDDTHDLATLNRWLSKERRIPVRNAIQRRVTTLTSGNA